MNKYLNNLYLKYEKKYSHETEYLNAVKQFLFSINDYVNEKEDIINSNVIESLINPDRVISFKVPWVNDLGELKINTGYRVQHSNAIGVYKGGTRFVSNLNESVLKFLAFEQTFKNSLTNLPLGGAKGGSDFNPLNKSDHEIKRFSESYMVELAKYIGIDKDVPAGDLGCGYKEIGYMYGMYKRITSTHTASFTSKHISYGGSLLRPESTGYGISYVTRKALNTYFNEELINKTVIISGSGQVAINTAYKMRDLKARVIALSSIYGVIYDDKGIDIELVDKLNKTNTNINKYLDKYPNATYYKNTSNIWKIKADIAIPAATQNELDLTSAKKLVKNNFKLVVEGSNKPSTNEAIEYFYNNDLILVPSKVANSGGVIVSSFEMAQNQTFTKWSKDEVDLKLKIKMEEIFLSVYEEAKALNDINNLEKAANILSFKKLYEAVKIQGL